MYSFGDYAGTLQKLIHLFKYQRISTMAGPFGRLLSQALPRDERIDVVVPVPLHWRKRWTRGFNQAELLAAEIARKRGVPVRRALKRRKPTVTQTGLSGPQRRANMAAAFAVARSPDIQGKRVLLVDDVFTTGATSRACARVLMNAGAKRVVVLTVARVDRRATAPLQWRPGAEQIEVVSSEPGS